ncbi:MAG TPA: hypothetical protein VIN67_02585 [Desulfobaccales bacterium]
MVNFGEAGRICLNQERQGACENCLWWEWDAVRGDCSNSHYHICPLYREQLFSLETQARARLEDRLQSGSLPANDGLADPPAAQAGESVFS